MQYQKPVKKFKPAPDPWAEAMKRNQERYEDSQKIGRAIARTR